MKKVLSILSGNIESGGSETYIKNLYENMNLEDIQIDILVPGSIIYEPYATILQNLGCNLIVWNISQESRNRYIQLWKRLKEYLKTNVYDIVHVNTGNLTIQMICLSVVKKMSSCKTISHSHGTLYPCGKIHEYIRRYMRGVVNKNADYRVSCSNIAAESLFGTNKDVIIAKNGINVDKYKFVQKTRIKYRSSLKIDDQFVIGSVGRLSEEKNFGFLLKVFSVVLQKNERSFLLIAGEGDQKSKLLEEARKLRISDRVSFLGVRDDIPDLMQCFDVFALASKREALGIVNIEAQASGLKCVVSEAIPRDADITGNVIFLSLHEPFEKWAETILQSSADANRERYVDVIKRNGYDLTDSYAIVEQIYKEE